MIDTKLLNPPPDLFSHSYGDIVCKEPQNLGLGSVGVALAQWMWPWLGGCDLSREDPLSCHTFFNPKRRRTVYDSVRTLALS